MSKPGFLLAAALLMGLPAAASAADLGKVTKVLRPQVRIFDSAGQPLGQIKAGDLKVPAPIVGYGTGASVGVNQGGRVVYMRGLDVQTDAKVNCAKVQTASRAAGSAYAATNLGLGSACERTGQ